MNAVFIDTNIFVYLLVSDQPKKQAECLPLFTAIQEGRLKPYTSNIVFLELIYTLHKHYRQTRRSITDKIVQLTQLRNLTIIEHTNTKKAIQFLADHNIKSGDCFIATQIPNGVTLITYDLEFTKLPEIAVNTPTEYLKQTG